MSPRAALVALLGAVAMCLGPGAAWAAPTPATDFFVTAPPGGLDPPATASPGSAAQVATAWAERNAARTGLSRPGADLEVREVERGPHGTRVVRLQQEVQGIPVFGAETVVAVQRDGDIASVTGERLGGATPDLRPGIAPADAREVALTDSAARNGVPRHSLAAGPARRVIFQPGLFGAPYPERSFLAWQVEVAGADDTVSDTVLVHADKGISVIIPRIAHARSRRICDGAGTTGVNLPCAAGTAARVEGGSAALEGQVNLAYDYAGDTWGYFSSVFGRDSWDGAGGRIDITVRACPSGQACPWQNAWWNGSEINLGNNYVTDDVVAHEFTHGVTQATANLRYYYQSGAINEAMSDIFGEFVDFGDGRGTDTAAARWLHAEDLPSGHNRSMRSPPDKGHPDRTGSSLYRSGTSDYGGVHSNSGVGNKAAYLITDGGTFNGRTITGLGQVKAQQVFYRALTTALRSGSGWQDLRSALYASCTGLIGSYGITSANCAQVDNAALATEMQLVPALAPGAEADVCASGQAPTYVVSDDADSWTRWNTEVISGAPVLNWVDWYVASGTGARYIRDVATASDGALTFMESTGVVVPSGGYLRFRHAYWLQDAVDGGVVEYSVRTGAGWGAWTSAMPLVNSGYTGGTIGAGAGTSLAGATAFTGVSRGYGSSRINLASLAGQTVRFRFRVATDGATGDQGWFIDDVGVYGCGAGDSTPPETSITGSPAASTRANWITLQFASSEANSTFQCAFDGGAYAACTSPKTYSSLAVGSHSFLVRARDPSGNVDSTPAVWEFTVDQTAPSTTISPMPAAASSSSTIGISFTSDDPSATFMCALDSGASATCVSPASWSGVSNGTHTMRVYAQDPAGNVDSTPAQATVRVDTVAPVASFTQVPGTWSRTTTASIGFTANEIATGVTFECARDAGQFAPCTSPVTYTGLTQGIHTVYLRPTDSAGNVGNVVSTSFTVDSLPPGTTITAGPGAWLNTGATSFTVTSSEAGTLECALDEAAFSACTSPMALTGLGDGAHTFRIRAIDQAGNIDATPATRAFSVDTTNPETVLIDGPAGRINTTSTTVSFDGRDSNFATFDCRLDSPTWAGCTSPRTLSGLAQGTHTFGARAVDLASNRDLSPVEITFVVDTAAPTTAITSGPAALTNASSVTIAFSSGDAAAAFECALDDDAYVGCTSPFAWDDVPEGAHVFQVRATDLAGNTDGTPATQSFTVDATAPVTTITQEPDASILGSSATVAMTADEAVARFECARDGGAFATCTSPHAFTSLGLGDHELSVRAVDLAGNVEESPPVVYVTRESPQAPEADPPADEPVAGDPPADPGAGPDPAPVGGSSGPGGAGAVQALQATAAPCAGLTAVARASCEAAATQRAATARATAALDRALAACRKAPPASRASCQARARAAYAAAVARARAAATLTVAKARCATLPPARRAACTRTAQAAYARAVSRR